MAFEGKPPSKLFWPRAPLHIMKKLAIFLVPSPLQHFATSSNEFSEKPAQAKTRPTDYLDGLRGVASLCVFIFHWAHATYPHVNNGYGYDDNWSLLQLPLIRIFYSGAAMVAIFFVVSGYVLTQRCIIHMRTHNLEALLSTLTSLTFRRAMRLFIPSLVSSFLGFLCASFGLLKTPKNFDVGWDTYLAYLDRYSNPFTWKIDFEGFYNPHLWTIAVEFRCSLILFLLCLGLAKTRLSYRLLIETAIVIHAFAHERWDAALFVAGMLLAEATVLYDAHIQHTSPPLLETPTPRRPTLKSNLTTLLLLSNLLLGIHLCTYPRDGASQSPGFRTLSALWPHKYSYKRRFWHSLGAMLVVSSISFLPRAQSVFTTSLARYLGKISYALYLVHGLTNRTFGKWIRGWVWRGTGKEGWALGAGWGVASLVYAPLVFWAADVFWRAVDVPAVRLARGVERVCGVREGRGRDGARE
ncbi:MAG: hypothetical protein MMC23_002968 [Stictis urceolatum]|nr:hypothetical protein [Stictis urceolata]